VENALVVELRHLNGCTILQSARPPCPQASLCLAVGNIRLIFIIVLVDLHYLDLVFRILIRRFNRFVNFSQSKHHTNG